MNFEELNELIAKLQSGDPAQIKNAVESIHQQVGSHLTRIVMNQGFQECEADDIVQNAMIYLMTHSARDITHLPGYVMQNVMWCCSAYRRKKRQRKEFSFFNSDSEQGDAGITLVDPKPSPEVEAFKSEREKLIQQILSQLPPDQAEVLVMKHYEDMTHKEIAAALNVSDRTVTNRLRRAIENSCRILDIDDDNSPGRGVE